MSKLADQLRILKIFNNWELLKRFGASGDVVIEYHSAERWSVYRTEVWSPLKHPMLSQSKRDRDVGCKEFLGKRSETFQLAVNWAMLAFGHDYVPSPFGGYVPTHVRHKAEQAAKRVPAAPEN